MEHNARGHSAPPPPPQPGQADLTPPPTLTLTRRAAPAASGPRHLRVARGGGAARACGHAARAAARAAARCGGGDDDARLLLRQGESWGWLRLRLRLRAACCVRPRQMCGTTLNYSTAPARDRLRERMASELHLSCWLRWQVRARGRPAGWRVAGADGGGLGAAFPRSRLLPGRRSARVRRRARAS